MRTFECKDCHNSWATSDDCDGFKCPRCGKKVIETTSKPKKLTNADRIRAMSDEELSVWIAGISECPACPKGGTECDAWTCDGAWLEWLKQEATDGTA